MTSVTVPTEIVDKARKFAEQVYELRKQNKDKFKDGSELWADQVGFVGEFCVCHAFGLPLPKLNKRKPSDDYDVKLLIEQKPGLFELGRFDVKVSRDLLINKEQLERKKKVDAFLFVSIDYSGYVTGSVELRFVGWILKKNVQRFIRESELRNGSVVYRVPKFALESAGVLFCLREATAND